MLYHIDTNKVNARRQLGHMNRLEQWHENGLIDVLMSEPAFAEASADLNADRTQKAMAYNHTLTLAETPEERALIAKIERAVFPGGATTASERADVEIAISWARASGEAVPLWVGTDK